MNMYCVNQGIFYIGDASLHVPLVVRFIVCFIFYIHVYLMFPNLSPVLRQVHLLIRYSLPITELQDFSLLVVKSPISFSD